MKWWRSLCFFQPALASVVDVPRAVRLMVAMAQAVTIVFFSVFIFFSILIYLISCLRRGVPPFMRLNLTMERSERCDFYHIAKVDYESVVIVGFVKE